MTQQTWKAWVRIGASPVAGPFIEDVTVYDCSHKPGYHRATITLDDDRAAAGREAIVEECARVCDRFADQNRNGSFTQSAGLYLAKHIRALKEKS